MVDAIRFEEEARLRSKQITRPDQIEAASELRVIATELRSLATLFAAWPSLAETDPDRLSVERAQLPPRLLELLRAGEEVIARTR